MPRRTKLEIAEIMRRVRSNGTSPELLFRREIKSHGYRFRTCDDRLPGKPDLVFPKQHVVVFVDGDFWHGHQWRRRRLPSVEAQFTGCDNRDYWIR